MDLGQAIALIQDDPATFISTEFVIVAGSGGRHGAGDTIFRMAARTGKGNGWLITIRDQNNPRLL